MATYTVNGPGLIARVRSRADMPGVKFCPDTEVLANINAVLGELYWKVVQSDEEYFTKSTSLAVTGGVDTYALPDDCSKMRGMDIPIGGGTYKITASRLEWQERNDFQGPLPSITAGAPVRFHVIARNLRVFPIPSASYSCTLWYIPQAPTLDAGGSVTWACEPGWEEYIINGAAAIMLRKEESFESAQACVANQAEVWQTILTTIRRDFSGPKKVARRRWRNNLYWPFSRPW